MAFIDMYKELAGVVPKVPEAYCKTLVNRAWRDVRRQNLWSFQLFESNWFSPSIINGGTVTTVQGSAGVVFDVTAAALIDAIGLVPSPVTARQFRIGVGTIYSIWAWDSGTRTATLNQPYVEQSGAGQTYSVFQCYYPAPFPDFKMFLTVLDPTNIIYLNTARNRSWVNARDRQRQNYNLPTHVVPFATDNNPTSPTYGSMLFELWGQPQYNLPYIVYGIRKGRDLSANTDTLPFAIGEDVVMELAKRRVYQWAEANKGSYPELRGANYIALMADAAAEYKRLYREYRKEDREVVDNWFVEHKISNSGPYTAYYNALAGVASPGFD